MECNVGACGSTSNGEKFTYWESWPVKNGRAQTPVGKGAKELKTDYASYTVADDTFGSYSQYGEIAFVCNADVGVDPAEWTNERNGAGDHRRPVGFEHGRVYGSIPSCMTTPGSLASTDIQPHWWIDPPTPPAFERATRQFSGKWDCCVTCPNAKNKTGGDFDAKP